MLLVPAPPQPYPQRIELCISVYHSICTTSDGSFQDTRIGSTLTLDTMPLSACLSITNSRTVISTASEAARHAALNQRKSYRASYPVERSTSGGWCGRTQCLCARRATTARGRTAHVTYALRNIDQPEALLFDCDGVFADRPLLNDLHQHLHQHPTRQCMFTSLQACWLMLAGNGWRTRYVSARCV